MIRVVLRDTFADLRALRGEGVQSFPRRSQKKETRAAPDMPPPLRTQSPLGSVTRPCSVRVPTRPDACGQCQSAYRPPNSHFSLQPVVNTTYSDSSTSIPPVERGWRKAIRLPSAPIRGV